MTGEYKRSSGGVHGEFKTVQAGEQWIRQLNKLKGENYDMIYYQKHPANSPDIVAWSHDKMSYVTVGGKTTYMVPTSYTKKVVTYSNGKIVYKNVLKDDMLYKNGHFYNKSGTIDFTVKNLQTQYISQKRSWWDQFGRIHN